MTLPHELGRAWSTRPAGGPLRSQAEQVVELLTDPARCQALLVTIPEETPVNELIETATAWRTRWASPSGRSS